jgi:hypothetical protein
VNGAPPDSRGAPGACRENVKNGLRFLRDRRDADGCFAARTSANSAVDHALAALALTEAYGMTSTGMFAEPARRGVAFALATAPARAARARRRSAA